MGRIRSLLTIGGAALLSVAPILVAGPALAASGGACQLAGTANFDPPGLSATPGNFTYTFEGTLSSCNSNVSGAPTSGKVAAGKDYAVTVSGTNATTGLSYSITYAAPQAKGSGGCGQSTTSGDAIATWSDGTTTVVSYTTTGAAAAVELTGTVVNSTTLNEVSSSGSVPAGAPSTYTVSSTNPSFTAGQSAIGQLAFTTTSPQSCATGLSTAGITGAIGIGSSS